MVSSSRAEEGVFDEWWLSPASWKLVVQQDGKEQTFVHDQGRTWSVAAADTLPVSVEILEPLIVEPAPEALLAGAKAESKPRAMGSVSLNCLVATRKDIASVIHGYASLDSKACFDSDGVMRVLATDQISLVRNGIKPFSNERVATEITGLDASGKLLAAEVKELNELDTSKADLGTKELVENIVLSHFFQNELPPGEHPKAVHKTAPEYPLSARTQHRGGRVAMHVVVNTNGHVESVDLLSATSPDLAESAEKAVRQWVYEPVQVDGQPRKAETFITVRYDIGG